VALSANAQIAEPIAGGIHLPAPAYSKIAAMQGASTDGQLGKRPLSLICSRGEKPVELKALGQCRACF
jgi:hypothetical protein